MARVAIRQKEVVQRYYKYCIVAAQIGETEGEKGRREEKEGKLKRAQHAAGPPPPKMSEDPKCPTKIYPNPKSFHAQIPNYSYRSPQIIYGYDRTSIRLCTSILFQNCATYSTEFMRGFGSDLSIELWFLRTGAAVHFGTEKRRRNKCVPGVGESLLALKRNMLHQFHRDRLCNSTKSRKRLGKNGPARPPIVIREAPRQRHQSRGVCFTSEYPLRRGTALISGESARGGSPR